MTGANTKLTAAVEAYFADLGRVRASGGATGERSSYGPLANLLNAVGSTLKPKVFCVGELADQVAGHPDFGLYSARQVQKGRPREGQTPERGVVEVKAAADDAWLTADSDQVSRYWGRYRLVLVTNTRDFVLVGKDVAGQPAKLETFQLAQDAEVFDRRLEKPRAFTREVGAGLGEYLSRALSYRAAIAEPKDLAWLLASYARDGLARVEATGDAPSLKMLRAALEEALGISFEGKKVLEVFFVVGRLYGQQRFSRTHSSTSFKFLVHHSTLTSPSRSWLWRAARLREHPSGGQRADGLAHRCCVPRRQYVRLRGVGALRCGRGGAVQRRGPGNGPRHPHLHDPAGVSGSRDAGSGIDAGSVPVSAPTNPGQKAL